MATSFGPIDVRLFGAKGDGIANDTTPILNAIDYAKSVGSGRIILGYVHLISQTIEVDVPNIFIEGHGGGIQHDAGTGPLAGSSLVWSGAAGATMARFKTPFGVGRQKITSVGARGISFWGNNLAARGLEVNSIAKGVFRDMAITRVTSAAYYITCGVTGTDLPEAADTQDCLFDGLSAYVGDEVPGLAANGFVLDGSANANTSFNEFRRCGVRHRDGAGWLFKNCDNNILSMPRAWRPSGSGYGFDFQSDTSDDTLIGPTWPSTNGCIVRGTSVRNSFIDIDIGNGSQLPARDPSAHYAANLRGSLTVLA